MFAAAITSKENTKMATTKMIRQQKNVPSISEEASKLARIYERGQRSLDEFVAHGKVVPVVITKV